ncbi:MAG: YggT family protein [Ectothiorhodospiraceae bacterium]|nr:YggT family protein [Chromatiales bacterium]MCP5157324.1 YggT family protein [Ectothiorhodospiraceae bacterium]
MGGGHVGGAATFLVDTLFGLYIALFMLRFLLQVARADFYNPISQFVVRATQPVLKPLRRVIPGTRGIDLATIVAMVVLQTIALYIILGLDGGSGALPGMLLHAVARLVDLALNVFFFVIIAQIVLSWVNPSLRNPATAILHRIAELLLGPARRVIPPMGGLDISPIPVLIGLRLASFLIVGPLVDIANQLL